MKTLFYYDYSIPAIGRLGIAEENGKLTAVFREQEKVEIPESFRIQETELLKKTDLQLREYFSGKRKEFSLPFVLKGTEFQKRVWRALLTISFGKTASYQEIAEAVGSPRAFRAVGQANHYNPISIIVPCHRVIGKSGKLVGYGGGLEMKEYLLQLEKQ